MLKILFLRFHYKLSDRQVMARIQTDMAFRWFLDLPLRSPVPNHTDGTYFRQRIGAECFGQVFQELVTQAREAGLVKDRLRLKDATHLLADVADVQPLQLAAQVRERLLQAAEPFFAAWVAAQRTQVETLRQTTAEFPDDERLAARVEHLREMTAQLHEQTAALPPAEDDRRQSRLQHALAVADKLLADRSDPQAKDRFGQRRGPRCAGRQARPLFRRLFARPGHRCRQRVDHQSQRAAGQWTGSGRRHRLDRARRNGTRQ